MNQNSQDEYLDSTKREKWSTISVIIGVLAFLLLLIKSVFWTILFAVFAF